MPAWQTASRTSGPKGQSRVPVSSWCFSGFLQVAAAAPVAAVVRTDGLAVRAEPGLRQDAPPGSLVITIVKRSFRRVHPGIDIHALGAQLEAMDAYDDFRRGQRFHIGVLTRWASRPPAEWRARRRSWQPGLYRRCGSGAR